MVAKHKGFPASLYDILQELGRVDQKLSGEPGSSSYQIHVSFNSYVFLFIRIIGTKDVNERLKLLDALIGTGAQHYSNLRHQTSCEVALLGALKISNVSSLGQQLHH